MKNFFIVMTISGEEYAHVSCGCEHGGLLGAYLLSISDAAKKLNVTEIEFKRLMEQQ